MRGNAWRIRPIKAGFRAYLNNSEILFTYATLFFFILIFIRKLRYFGENPYSSLFIFNKTPLLSSNLPSFQPRLLSSSTKVPFFQSNFHPEHPFPETNIHTPSIPKSHTRTYFILFKLHFLKKYLSLHPKGTSLIYIFISIFSRIFRVFSACITLSSEGRKKKKEIYSSRGLGFDIHYRFICMMDATQCVSRMQRQQGQSCLRTKVSLLPVASRRNNDRECPRTAGTAPNTIPYVLPSTSSFYSLGPLSTGRERERKRERLLSSLFHPPPVSFHSAPRPLFLYRVFFPTTSVYPFVGMLFCFVDFCFCFLFRPRATRIRE